MIILRVTLLVIISLVIGSVPTYAGPSFSKVVVFGDSNVDSGEAQEGSLYNLTYGTLIALGPPNVGGRSCNGPVVVEYVAEMLRVPLKNYGVGGAMTGLKSYLPEAYPGILYYYPLIEYTGVLSQLNNFQASLGKRKADSKALYIYWAGSNDLFNATDDDLFLKINTALDNIKSALTTLNNLGARYIVVATRTVRRDYPSQNNINGIIFNARLRILVQHLSEKLKANIQIFEAFDLTTEMTYNPDAYGFTETTAPCIVPNFGCDTYISWDDVHKTTRVHKLMAEELVLQALNMIQDKD
jgi:phospholipase/lecithinase/hemolysin